MIQKGKLGLAIIGALIGGAVGAAMFENPGRSVIGPHEAAFPPKKRWDRPVFRLPVMFVLALAVAIAFGFVDWSLLPAGLGAVCLLIGAWCAVLELEAEKFHGEEKARKHKEQAVAWVLVGSAGVAGYAVTDLGKEFVPLLMNFFHTPPLGSSSFSQLGDVFEKFDSQFGSVGSDLAGRLEETQIQMIAIELFESREAQAG